MPLMYHSNAVDTLPQPHAMIDGDSYVGDRQAEERQDKRQREVLE